jgi:hypothetical protein
MNRPKRREQEALFDPELTDLPESVRWREWMARRGGDLRRARSRSARGAGEAGRTEVQAR